MISIYIFYSEVYLKIVFINLPDPCFVFNMLQIENALLPKFCNSLCS